MKTDRFKFKFYQKIIVTYLKQNYNDNGYACLEQR